jgi:hypothetical protein
VLQACLAYPPLATLLLKYMPATASNIRRAARLLAGQSDDAVLEILHGELDA